MIITIEFEDNFDYIFTEIIPKHNDKVFVFDTLLKVETKDIILNRIFLDL